MKAWAISQECLGTFQVRFLISGNFKTLGGVAFFCMCASRVWFSLELGLNSEASYY